MGLRLPRFLPCGLVTLALLVLVGWPGPALAQSFDIHAPESKAGSREAEILNGVNFGALKEQARNAHEFKFAWGLTDRWMFEVGALVEKSDGADTKLARISLENILVLVPVKSTGTALGWFTSLEIATSEVARNTVIFGPLVQVNAGAAMFLVNPLLEKSFGQNAADGLAFSYIWKAKYEVRHGLGIGAMGYGRIENLAGAPAFSDQDHRLGPALFLDLEIEKGRSIDVSIGTFFGVTKAAPDASLMVNFGLPFGHHK